MFAAFIDLEKAYNKVWRDVSVERSEGVWNWGQVVRIH